MSHLVVNDECALCVDICAQHGRRQSQKGRVEVLPSQSKERKAGQRIEKCPQNLIPDVIVGARRAKGAAAAPADADAQIAQISQVPGEERRDRVLQDG
jgi:hypothetical protein